MAITYNPKISISSAIGITGHLVLVLYEATAPNIPVYTSPQLAPPHNSSRQLQITGLNPVIHLAKLFETNGIATTGTVRANFSLDPQFPTVDLRADLFIYGGSTTGFDVGDNKYVDAASYLDGWDYALEIRNIGTLDPDLEYTKDLLNNPTIVSGTDISGGGTYQIAPDEVWVFHFAPKMTVYSVAPPAAAWFTTTELITANRTIVSADLGKNFIVASENSTITITLPNLASISDNRHLFFTSEGGAHINAVFKTQGSDEIVYGSYVYPASGTLILGQAETLIIYKFNGKYYVSNDLEGVKNVGKFFLSYRRDNLLNGYHCGGQELSRAIYARVWDYILNRLDPSLIVSKDDWLDTTLDNFGKFHTGDGSTTFGLPYLVTFPRGVDGILRGAGSFQDQAIKETTLTLKQGNSYTGNGGGGVFGRGANSPNDVVFTIGNGPETHPPNNGYYICINI